MRINPYFQISALFLCVGLLTFLRHHYLWIITIMDVPLETLIYQYLKIVRRKLTKNGVNTKYVMDRLDCTIHTRISRSIRCQRSSHMKSKNTKSQFPLLLEFKQRSSLCDDIHCRDCYWGNVVENIDWNIRQE